ncbi:MAG TPA: ABC transporter ATP-binding protein [Clostridia bacterium]|nr:ABC transporter ATP-binding protein [Clostridia bacterium]
MANHAGPVKVQNPAKTLLRIFSYIGKYKGSAIFALVGLILSIAANVAGTFYIKIILELVINVREGLATSADLIQAIGSLIGIYAVGIVAVFTQERLMINVVTGVMRSIRDEMFEKMERLPVKYFDTRTHGEIMSRYTNDTEALRQFVASAIPQLFSSCITVVAMFTMMVILSWQLSLFVVGMLALMLISVGRIAKKSGSYFIKQQAAIGKVNGYIEEYIEGQKVTKVFCHEKKVKEGFAGLNEELCNNATAANAYANSLMPIMGNLSYLLYASVAIIGSYLVLNGALGSYAAGIATLIAFMQYSRQLSSPIGQAAQQFNGILHALAGAERIFDLMDAEPEKDEGYVTLVNAIIDEEGNITESEKPTGRWAWKHPHKDGTLTYTELKGDIRFESVTFSYEENKTVLKDISLYAHPGQKIALVGSTGAGKTTITNLLTRFYDVPDGKIRYDGININKIKKDDLRSSLGMVLQDTHLFTGTVKENIRYGRPDATDEEVYEAARLANADFFISHLPEGYDTVLTADGANLSQGQRQLLAIARVAAADPPVLILDEATSSIDTRTEWLIQKGMDRLMQGRTVFIIAHRLSTVRNADAILVIENGEIIERGNHESLINQKGRYYQLNMGMFELS